MAESFFPYVKPNYLSKDGTTPLYVRYNYNRTKRTLISTGHSIKPQYWDEKKKWIKRACPNHDEINLILTKLTSKIGDILSYANDNNIDPTIDFVLLELEKNREYTQRSNTIDVFATLDIYIEEKRGKVSVDQIKDYNSLKKHLTNFKHHSSQPISFRNLNLTFYNEFIDYLFYKVEKPDGSIGLLTNSAGKIIRLLKGFVNYQISKGVIPSIDLSCFKVVEEETDAIYLTDKELSEVYMLDLSHDKELEEIRDLFIVGCYTGLRYSDLSTLSSDNIDIVNGYINLKQRKVHKAVVIPLIDYVPNILVKYNYNLPKISSYKFNARLKEIGQIAGLNQKIEIVRKKGITRVNTSYAKWKLISSHTCRRSFCTNMYLSGFPAEELMRISGHKSTSAFMRYIKVDNMQAAQRLKELRRRMSFN